jgi:hypothetical protein
MNPDDESFVYSQICPPCYDTNQHMMEGIEQVAQQQDEVPTARRK